MFQTTVEGAVKLLSERQTKKYPTAPLHSEGYEVGGMESPTIYIGWVITPMSDLTDEFKKHVKTEKSELSTMVSDISEFLENVKNKCRNWVSDDDDDNEESDDGDGDDEVFDVDVLNEICTIEYLKMKYGSSYVHYCKKTTHGGPDEGSDETIENIILGIELGDQESKKFAQKLKEAREELLKLIEDNKDSKYTIKEWPNSQEDMRVFVCGNEEFGTCY